mmetsp:Transcript_18122/g.36388  ORF Transcript_18122/g.36388 Transcript_18122/m.36388 type:complete len:376 (-) Transcript_18122:54-1181(-)
MLLSPSPYAAIYPQQYIAYRSDVTSTAEEPAITIDGNLDKPFWNDIPWTEDFVDISTNTPPSQRTMVKMRWDDHFLFVGARMEETDVWATLTEENSVIFHDNDFEIFVDCDGSNHNYKEFEINARGTTWTLLLDKPYDDGGGENSKRVDPVNGYDMSPFIRSATKVYPNDAINRPDVRNTHWTAEVALPISKLMERNELAKRPSDGHQWRINFSRVQWGVKVNEKGKYEKNPCCQSCAVPGTAAEDNWTWSPQGKVAMHLPERWGILQFSSSTSPRNDEEVLEYKEWDVRCCAMALYYAQKGYYNKEGKYTDLMERLKPFFKQPFLLHSSADVRITITEEEGFTATATIGSLTATINQERYLVVRDDVVSSPSTE